MPSHLHIILCHGDKTLLTQMNQQLDFLRNHFLVHCAPFVAEAQAHVQALQEEQQQLALILCSDEMPRQPGVDLLISLHENPATRDAHKVLLCMDVQAEKVVRAVNHGGLDYCLLHPWTEEDFQRVVVQQLTEYVVRHEQQPINFANVLDREAILRYIHQNASTFLEYR
jgi:response regulator RpfG family c-di-GMP phosphodiesterase